VADSSARPTEIDSSARPTEALGHGGYYTADPYQAYGQPPNATLPYPTYESLLAQQSQQQSQPGWEPADQPPPQQRGTGTLVGIGVGIGLLLAAAVGVGALLIGRHHGDDTSAASAPSTDTSSYAEPAPAEPSPESPLPAPHAGTGATIGSITANDGSTLSVRGMLGAGVDTVHTDAQTRVVSLNGSKVSDLKIGDMVIVQGETAADGSITARLIISTSFGN
jgi:hypothetical protein